MGAGARSTRFFFGLLLTSDYNSFAEKSAARSRYPLFPFFFSSPSAAVGQFGRSPRDYAF